MLPKAEIYFVFMLTFLCDEREISFRLVYTHFLAIKMLYKSEDLWLVYISIFMALFCLISSLLQQVSFDDNFAVSCHLEIVYCCI